MDQTLLTRNKWPGLIKHFKTVPLMIEDLKPISATCRIPTNLKGSAIMAQDNPFRKRSTFKI